jgi:putative DNA primase/helicase
MTPAEKIAAALDGRREGRGWRCRCPVHGGRSLLIQHGREGRLLVRCWAGCAGRDVLAELRRRGLLDGEEGDFNARPGDAQTARNHDADARQRLRKIALAIDIWGASYPAAGTVVEGYLRSRGITLPPPTTLRYHPMHGCYGSHPSGSRRPQMVALVEHVEYGPVAVSRCFLTADGRGKASLDPPRLFTGPVSGAAVRLSPAAAILMIGEGVETCLAAMQATAMPVWAALSTSGLIALTLPPVVRQVIILADNDRSGAGERAAYAAADRWLAEGRAVRIALPPEPGTDFNDMLPGGSAAQATEADNAA